MKLSFIILNYKTPHHLRLCIQHIEALKLGVLYEIIVVDNASGDESVKMVRTHFPFVKLIENEQNIGHSAGNNVGIQAATGEYIAMVNPDIIFREKKDISAIVEYLDEHQQVGILGPKIQNPDGTVQYSCYRRYSTWTPLYRRTFLGKFQFAQQDINRHLMKDFAHDRTQEVEWLLGACMFVRKKAIEDAGMLDERFFLYFADYEWCDRTRAHHWQIVYFHDTTGIIHYHKRESASHRLSMMQIVSYVTRIHIKDWITYLKVTKAYAKSS